MIWDMERSRYIRTSKKRDVWYSIGVVTDKLVRDLREIERQKKLGTTPFEDVAPEVVTAIATVLEVSGEGAATIHTAPSPTAELGCDQGDRVGGIKLNR